MALEIDYSSGIFEAAPSGETVGTVTGNATLDLSSGNVFSHTPTANTTFVFSNPPASGTGHDFTLKVTGANVAETYDIANASYDSKSFDVSTQQTRVEGVVFKDDGLAMYIVGTDTDMIHQYTLSTAWDVSTASYANKSLAIGTQDNNPKAIQFKNDGTSVYIAGSENDSVYQYNLTTAWDVSTGSYASKSMSINTQDLNPAGMFFKPDGTKVYITGTTNDKVYQYALTTAWDISTGSYESKSLSVGSQANYPRGVFFNANGDEVYVNANVLFTSADVFKYTLSTAWDVSTGSYSGVSFSTASEGYFPTDLFFKPDGAKMYVSEESNDKIYQYSTAAAPALATITWPSSVKWAGGTAPSAPANGEKDVYNFFTLDGGTTYYGFQAGDAMA